MRYVADRHEADGVYSETFDADDRNSAGAICKQNGWILRGDNVMEFSAEEMSQAEADEMCRQLNGGGVN